MEDKLYFYKMTELNSVYDGDTITATVDYGFKLRQTNKFRLLGIDTPELRGDTLEEARVARDALREVLADADKVYIRSVGRGKYGRYLADIYAYWGDHVVHVNQWMIDEGYAKPYGA